MPHLSEPCPQPYARAPVMAAGFGLVALIAAITVTSNGIHAFFSLGGLVVVAGGVIAVAFMSFQASDVQEALAAVVAILQEPRTTQDSLHEDMKQIVAWAHLIKGQGLRAFKSRAIAQKPDDAFLRYGLIMVASEYAAEDVRAMMRTAADAAYDRDCIPVEVLRSMASHAPAFGMIGTLLGMVTMLAAIGDSLASVKSVLAVAFLATLYGVLSARMIYMPAASRLQQEVDAAYARNNLIAEGMALLAAKRSPYFIQDSLNAYLRPDRHDYMNQISAPASGIVVPMGQRFGVTAPLRDRNTPQAVRA